MPENLLSGIRVIDCAGYIAAPCAATVMADFGADVIKVERPGAGDVFRALSALPTMPQSEHNYCWILDNRNKRSLALDLKRKEGQSVLHRLAASADVFITNYQPRLIEKFNIGYDVLRGRNPRLIYGYVSGFGEAGPEAGAPAFDQTAYWARSGLMGLTHGAGSEPSRGPTGIGDHPTGMSLAAGIMMALYARQRTGKGARVATSLMANGVWANSSFIQAEHCGAAYPARRSRADCGNALSNHYVSRDGKRFLLCALDVPKHWPALCRIVGRPDLLDDPRYRTFESRTANARPLIAALDEGFRKRDMEDIAADFRRNDMPFSPVSLLPDIVNDIQMQAEGLFPEIEGGGRPLRTVASPIVVEGVEKAAPRPAPNVGEHSREVLREIGCSETEIDGLFTANVAGAPENSA